MKAALTEGVDGAGASGAEVITGVEKESASEEVSFPKERVGSVTKSISPGLYILLVVFYVIIII